MTLESGPSLQYLLTLGLLLPAFVSGQGPQFHPPKNLNPPMIVSPSAVLCVDADGNGSQDLVVLAYGSSSSPETYRSFIHINDGHGRFPTFKWLPKGMGDQHGVSGDFDGDGDVDLLVDGPVRAPIQLTGLFLLRNDGAGNYTVDRGKPAHVVKSTLHITNVAVGDVDRDGDLDLVVGHDRRPGRGPAQVVLNDGKGLFSLAAAGRIPGGDLRNRPLLLLDVDQDKDPDLIVGETGQTRLFLNDGRGFFSDVSARQMPTLGKEDLAEIAVLDAEGDGDPDLVVSSDNGKKMLFLNSKGVFRDATSTHFPKPTANRFSISIATGDVDADGDIDIYIGDLEAQWITTGVLLGPGQNRLYTNNGNGVFKDATSVRLPSRKDRDRGLQLQDLDQDGDPDLIGNSWKPSVQYNLHRHMQAITDPILGKTWWMSFYAQPGYATQSQTIVPFLGAALLPQSIPVAPFGAWALSPQYLIALPGPTIPRPGGRSWLGWGVPGSPRLLGVRLHVQGLWLHGATANSWRLGNVVSGTIR